MLKLLLNTAVVTTLGISATAAAQQPKTQSSAATTKSCTASNTPCPAQEQKTLNKTTSPKVNGVERKTEEQRLKVLFVDVNSVMEGIGTSLDWTANQLDGYFAETEDAKGGAKAWGHVVFGWQPIEGQTFDTENFPVKFKVKARLPNLEDKVELILSDGDDDDFETLPYESVRPEALRLEENSIGAAIQFLSSKGKHVRTSSRLGVSESQVYARTSITYRSKHFEDQVTFNVQPAIEYYMDDGWGARLLVDFGYRLADNAEVRYNVSLRDRESYDDVRWRNGIYHIYATGEKSAFVTGYSSSGELEQNEKIKVYYRRVSTRYRFNALRSWIYFEIEPFVEFGRDDADELDIAPADFRYDFERNRGIAFRFEGHYGYF